MGRSGPGVRVDVPSATGGRRGSKTLAPGFSDERVRPLGAGVRLPVCWSLGDAPESWADDDPRVELLVRGREVEVMVKQAWKRCPGVWVDWAPVQHVSMHVQCVRAKLSQPPPT